MSATYPNLTYEVIIEEEDVAFTVLLFSLFLSAQPFHVSIFATLSSEVSTRAIVDKVTSASGSKINIKNN
jgi:hypothetical protein